MGILNSKKRDIYEFEDNDWPPPTLDQRQDSIATAIPLHTSLVATLVTVGVAVIAANIGLALIPTPPRQTLENDRMCGLPSGGQVILNTMFHVAFLNIKPVPRLNATLIVYQQPMRGTLAHL